MLDPPAPQSPTAFGHAAKGCTKCGLDGLVSTKGHRAAPLAEAGCEAYTHLGAGFETGVSRPLMSRLAQSPDSNRIAGASQVFRLGAPAHSWTGALWRRPSLDWRTCPRAIDVQKFRRHGAAGQPRGPTLRRLLFVASLY